LESEVKGLTSKSVTDILPNLKVVTTYAFIPCLIKNKETIDNKKIRSLFISK
jgi:hypothetical protein